MQHLPTLNRANLAGKTVLVRADLNVPTETINGHMVVTDTTRLDRIIPTLKAIMAQNARVAILAHFGRPHGEKKLSDSLQPIAAKLAELLGQHVAFIDDCVGDNAKAQLQAQPLSSVSVLENVRFYAGEEQNDAAFAKALAQMGDVFVSDAFSAAHRAHASISGITHYLPSYAGLLMAEEILALTKALENPTRPTAAVVGGSKVSTKLSVLTNIVQKVDMLVLGGGMANTFLAALGHPVGKSLYEPDMISTAKEIMAMAATKNCTILLPTDVVVAKEFAANVPTQNKLLADVAADDRMLDVGPQSVAAICAQLATAKTIMWNGPLGAFELKPFDAATNALAQFVAAQTKAGALLSVAGGGDTVAALENAGVADQFSYLSTAGGAFLEWLEGKTLPGVQALYDAAERQVDKAA
jgi:phosphoglycerate kinase